MFDISEFAFAALMILMSLALPRALSRLARRQLRETLARVGGQEAQDIENVAAVRARDRGDGHVASPITATASLRLVS